MPKSLDNNMSPFARAQVGGLVGKVNEKGINVGGRPTLGSELMWIEPFLEAIAEGSSVAAAARRAGVAHAIPRRRYRSDKQFRTAWNEVAQIATKNLEQEAQRRAYHGVLKPVYQKGVRVGCVREYSDTLLVFLLKSRKPQVYREGYEGPPPGAGPTFNVSGDVKIGGVFEDISRDATIIAAPNSNVQPHSDAEPVDAAQPDHTEAKSEADRFSDADLHP